MDKIQINSIRKKMICRPIGYILIAIFITACSTTKNLPEGEVLYTGIHKIEVTNQDHSQAGDNAMEEIEGALSYPPNNSLFGSSTKRIPFPIGLWIYNAFVNSEKGIGKWIFNKFAAKPVFITTVNPEVRTAVAYNVLRENSFFNGNTSFKIIPDEKNERKAKISYQVEINNRYTYDSIRYMRVRHFADTLIQGHADKTLLHKGDNFNVIKLESERQRISTLLRNSGFYFFRPEYIVYDADTLISPGKVWLRITRKPGTPANALKPYHIGNISIHLNNDNSGLPKDSVQYKDLTIYYQGKLQVRPPVLYGRLTFKPGDLYTQEEQQRTQTGISRLNIFRYADFKYTPQDTTRRLRNNLLDLNINTMYDLPYDGEFEINVTNKSNNYAGPGAIFGLTHRNAFKGGETLSLQLRGSYEWQTGKLIDDNSSKINSYEIELNSTLTFPFLLFPGYIYKDLTQPSSTSFRLSMDLMNRATFFRMLSFSGNMTYDFRPTPVTKHSIIPFRLTYTKLYPTDKFKEIAEENKSLYLSLQDQFIPAMGYTFTFDNSTIARRNNFWWETSVTQAGNITNGISTLSGKDFNKIDKNLLGNKFANFIKGTSEIRYNYRIDRNNRLVSRIMAGVIYSYGNARVSPYGEQFFVGGANSVRAFAIRSVGPGRYKTPEDKPYAYIDRTGDLKFEANLEYRFKIIGNLNGAVFLDAGGIWLIREDTDRPEGQLKKEKFLNDLATGTGVGLRYDLSFLIIRLDMGIGLHLPYDTDGEKGYYNIPANKRYSFHLAVGYPF